MSLAGTMRVGLGQELSIFTPHAYTVRPIDAIACLLFVGSFLVTRKPSLDFPRTIHTSAQSRNPAD